MGKLILCLCTCGVLFGYTRGNGWRFQFLTNSLIGRHRNLGYTEEGGLVRKHKEILKVIKI